MNGNCPGLTTAIVGMRAAAQVAKRHHSFWSCSPGSTDRLLFLGPLERRLALIDRARYVIENSEREMCVRGIHST